METGQLCCWLAFPMYLALLLWSSFDFAFACILSTYRLYSNVIYGSRSPLCWGPNLFVLHFFWIRFRIPYTVWRYAMSFDVPSFAMALLRKKASLFVANSWMRPEWTRVHIDSIYWHERASIRWSDDIRHSFFVSTPEDDAIISTTLGWGEFALNEIAHFRMSSNCHEICVEYVWLVWYNSEATHL